MYFLKVNLYLIIIGKNFHSHLFIELLALPYGVKELFHSHCLILLIAELAQG